MAEEVNPKKVSKYKPQRRSVSTMELMKLTSESSKYHLYEVEDVINHMIAHMQILLERDGSIKIDGIGTISIRKSKPREFYSAIYKRSKLVYTTHALTIKADAEMKRLLRRATDEQREANEREQASDTGEDE